jgi:hypothetical protein
MHFQGRVTPSPGPENEPQFYRRVMAPPAPRNSIFRGGWRHHPPIKNELYFQGRVKAPPAAKDEFQGRVSCYSTPAPFVGTGYILTRRYEKALLQIIFL